MYESFFKPYIAKHETEIDRNLLELRTRAGDMAVLYFQKVANYVQTRSYEILQYIASQSQSQRPRSQVLLPCLPSVSGIRIISATRIVTHASISYKFLFQHTTVLLLAHLIADGEIYLEFEFFYMLKALNLTFQQIGSTCQIVATHVLLHKSCLPLGFQFPPYSPN